MVSFTRLTVSFFRLINSLLRVISLFKESQLTAKPNFNKGK